MVNYYDYFESFKVELPYIISGWLDNRGKFYECYWGQHTSLAYEIGCETTDYSNIINLVEEALGEVDYKDCRYKLQEVE